MEVRPCAAATPRTRPARDTHATRRLRTRARDTRPCTMHGPTATSRAARPCNAKHTTCDKTHQQTAHCTLHTALPAQSAGSTLLDLGYRRRVRKVVRVQRCQKVPAPRMPWHKCDLALHQLQAHARPALPPAAAHQQPPSAPCPHTRARDTPTCPPERAHAARGRRDQPKPKEAASARGSGCESHVHSHSVLRTV